MSVLEPLFDDADVTEVQFTIKGSYTAWHNAYTAHYEGDLHPITSNYIRFKLEGNNDGYTLRISREGFEARKAVNVTSITVSTFNDSTANCGALENYSLWISNVKAVKESAAE